MNKTIIFAHYDIENIIDECTIYYLKELQKISKNIIFVSDCNIEEKELKKLDNIARFVHAKRHGEYDFGSYKIGWKIAQENGLLENADRLYFVNDSCIGPFQPIDEIEAEMENKNCDFWGITDNENRIYDFFVKSPTTNNRHIQSYFLVFKKQVFESDVFKNFMENITKEENKTDIILKYEIGLTKALCEAGFSYEVLSNTPILDINYQDLKEINNDVFVFMKKCRFKTCKYTIIYDKKLKTAAHKEIVNSYKSRFRNKETFAKKIKSFFYYLKMYKKQHIRIHFKEKRVFFNGKWYTWGKSN